MSDTALQIIMCLRDVSIPEVSLHYCKLMQLQKTVVPSLEFRVIRNPGFLCFLQLNNENVAP